MNDCILQQRVRYLVVTWLVPRKPAAVSVHDLYTP